MAFQTMLASISLLSAAVLVSAAPVHEDVIFGRWDVITDPSNKDYMDYIKCMDYAAANHAIISKTRFSLQWGKTKDPNKFTWTVITPMSTTTETFELGKEFQYMLGDGRKAKSTVTFDGTSVTNKQKIGDKVEGQTVSKMEPKGMKATMSCKGKSVIMDFKRNTDKSILDGFMKF